MYMHRLVRLILYCAGRFVKTAYKKKSVKYATGRNMMQGDAIMDENGWLILLYVDKE